uniref:CDGSH iron-sulfur domain-containing protein n=1 Tax=Scolopendra viridis TaxID=118503 RepID=A0A4D5R9C6_SCOVI
MEAASHLVKVSLPNYLSNLPIPETVGGIFKLSVRQWLSLVPFLGTVSFLTWVTYTRFTRTYKGPINPRINKENPKVVHAFEIEDLGDRVSFCRCWRSSQFPYCDGTHNEHNKTTGDNVGPVCIKKK